MLEWWLVLLLGGTADPADEPDVPPPSLDLLQFLGQFEDAQGHWIDPLSLDDPLARNEDDDEDETDDDRESHELDPPADDEPVPDRGDRRRH